MDNTVKVGVCGAGAMGTGIAQVAAMAGHSVVVYDNSAAALNRARRSTEDTLQKLQDKGKIASAENLLTQYEFTDHLAALDPCGLVIEAVIENLDIKRQLFSKLEKHVSSTCVLATNTSSLSVTSIAAVCNAPERVLGIHFFNPAPLMALVEVIPALQTQSQLPAAICNMLLNWGKVPVTAKDTPGFIVNRIARPYYGEALRIYEEGIADMATIDWAMTRLGGFKMGPFALMDLIGHDVNYVVTETVFQSFFYDPRYKPSFAQKRLLEAGWLGKKTGRGFYNYAPDAQLPTPTEDQAIGIKIVERIVAMLINEAADALHLNIATAPDIETAMTSGVNYPKGLLEWANEWGIVNCVNHIDKLYHHYHEDRYRVSALLRNMAAENRLFNL